MKRLRSLTLRSHQIPLSCCRRDPLDARRRSPAPFSMSLGLARYLQETANLEPRHWHLASPRKLIGVYGPAHQAPCFCRVSIADAIGLANFRVLPRLLDRAPLYWINHKPNADNRGGHCRDSHEGLSTLPVLYSDPAT